MTGFIDLHELDTDAVRDIVASAGCEWPAGDDRESRLFRFCARRIATEAFRRGVASKAQLDEYVALLDKEQA